MGEISIDLSKIFNRLNEINSDLSNIGEFLEGFPLQEGSAAEIAEILSKTLIPGFCAYYLAEEGKALHKVLTALLIKESKIEEFREYLESLEQLFEYVSTTSEKFKSLKSEDVLEKWLAEIKEQKKHNKRFNP